MSDSGKITSSHRSRAAVIYVRQSTLIQLERNTESTARQYDLVNRALQLGWPKQLAMSVSTTQRRPCQDSSMSTCRASCAERLGRNPKLHGRKSASKTGSSTIFTAACTIRSRTAGIESGLCSVVPGFGMNTRRPAAAGTVSPAVPRPAHRAAGTPRTPRQPPG